MFEVDLSEEDINCLLQLSKIEENQKELLISIINNYKKSQPYTIIIQEISDKLNVEYDLAESFISTYISLLRTKSTYNLTDEELLTSLYGNIITVGEYDEKDIDLIKNWVSRVISIPNKDILISSIAYNVAYSNSNVYYYSEIFEELRPVFVNDDLAGLALYHTIKVHYEAADDKHSNIYMVLDDSDIDSLINLLTKAKEKAEMIKTKYKTDVINI